MNNIFWVPPAHQRELRAILVRGWLVAGGLAVFSLSAILISMQDYAAGENPLISISLASIALMSAFLFSNSLKQAIAYSFHTQSLFKEQEQDISNETTRMLAQIEVELGSGR